MYSVPVPFSQRGNATNKAPFSPLGYGPKTTIICTSRFYQYAGFYYNNTFCTTIYVYYKNTF